MRRLVATMAVAIFTLGVARSSVAEPSPGRGVVVHLDSPQSVDLERATGDKRNPFYVVCTSPCDEALPADGEYRISGDSVRFSRRFVLPDGASRDVIAVRPASSAAFQIGIALISLGGLSLGIGLLVTVANGLADDPDGGSSNGQSVGLAVAAGGLAAAIGGIVVAVVNRKTQVRQTGETTGEVMPPPVLSAAVWRGGLRREGMAPPTGNVPLLSATF